ncbi:hypothetical protein [Phaeocystidibacter marisrubri]|nr:hypothetical protein [Phaeocystidibacter marisrubri]
MKRIASLFALVWGGLTLQAQVTTLPAENINPEDTLVIYVDINALDMSLGHNQLLKDAVDAGEDMYIWTWSPAEHAAGHPLANGIGSQAWKNSNDTLRMTPEGGYVFSYTLVPTDFYEVDAATCYANDLEFLVKPKDGGGYGDPDIKSSDFLVAIDPPSTQQPPVSQFPAFVSESDVVTVVYDNNREPKSTMQNLQEGEVYVYIGYWLDGEDVEIAEPHRYCSFAQVGTAFPELAMDEVEPGIFQFSMQTNDFLDGQGQSIIQVRIVVKKGNTGISVDGRNDQDLLIDLEACP